MKSVIASLFLLLSTGVSLAQSSASYTIENHVLNAGGRPDQGAISQSADYRISADAIGEAIGAARLTSASFLLDGGTLAPYGPVGEVTGLRFASQALLEWDLTSNASSYAVYRNTLSTLPATHGACAADDLIAPQWNDATAPAAGSGLFYLVTASNRLDEEGTRGSMSDGSARSDADACP